MAKKAYDAWIAGLPEDQRAFVQTIMAMLMAMLDDRYNTLAADVHRAERRLKTNSERIAELHLRLDQYETRQWSAATEAIEQFAQSQLPANRREELIAKLHQLADDVETLKQRQASDGSAE